MGRFSRLAHKISEMLARPLEELMEDVDEAIYKGWHKERTAEMLVNTIGRKVRIIDMALRPLSAH